MKAENTTKTPSNSQALTSVEREFNWDAFIKVEKDIKDYTGKVLYKAGSRIKLYQGLTFADLLFLDGTNPLHIKWALLHKAKCPCATLMLVQGSSKDLNTKYGEEFYEDNSHYFMNKFGIKKIPALVRHKGETITIKEINIK